MAKLVFGMNQSLDGYVDHMAFAPSPTLFRHFIEEAQGQAGSLYGRQMYEVMRYWDDDHPEWEAAEHAFAAAWRNQPKWVVSRSLKSVGPNARLVEDDLEGAIRALKAERDGEIEVSGPDLAHSLTERGLIDIESTCTPSCLVTASHISPGPGRRSASRPMIGSARM
jgi:dihydrofolate reductase